MLQMTSASLIRLLLRARILVNRRVNGEGIQRDMQA